MLRKKSDFYREVTPPDQLSSLTQGTPIGRSDNPDGTNPHSALPNGDSARNIGRPSPDSPNLKYRNLDRAEANGRTPAEGQDFGYVHDSGSGSARVIPYDSGFANNGSVLRRANSSYTDPYVVETGVKSSYLSSRVASRYLESARRDDPKFKNTGHGGLDTWFAGHGGGKPDDRATWGDWIAVTPVKHTIEKEDGETKTYDAGDIVGPCAVSSEASWASVTDGGKHPLKCMPRDKAHDLTKEQRATLARKKRREESKAKNGQKPVLTPTFSEEGKNMIEKKASKAPLITFNKTKSPSLDVLFGISYGTTDQLKRLLPEGFMERAQGIIENEVKDVTLSGVSPWSISSYVWSNQRQNLNYHYKSTGIHEYRGDPKAGEIVHLGGTFSVHMTGNDPHISGSVKCVFPLSYITIEERKGPFLPKRVEREAHFYIDIPVKIDLSNSDSFNDIYLMWLEGKFGSGKTASQMAVRVAKKYLRG